MYLHDVFPAHWINGFCYNFFHPPLFCGIAKTGTGEKPCGLKKLGERAYVGGETPQVNYVKNIKMNKDLLQVECFQCFLSTKNSNSASFLFKIK